jgi:hypothetical protein
MRLERAEFAADPAPDVETTSRRRLLVTAGGLLVGGLGAVYAVSEATSGPLVRETVTGSARFEVGLDAGVDLRLRVRVADGRTAAVALGLAGAQRPLFARRVAGEADLAARTRREGTHALVVEAEADTETELTLRRA